jgi:predicted molibdopterin-dependent oxidoreductase YjgC
MSGVDIEEIEKAASMIRDSKKIVFIHSPDRLQDRSPGDMETLANLVVLLRAAGNRADLLLPRIIGNSAALEVTGADPAFLPGRVAAEGGSTRADLRERLESGGIRAALIIGEDPLAWGRTGEWFSNVEFLAAMDWTDTETTQYADVVLPGSTFLETGGTRVDFEGHVVEFTGTVNPPSGLSGRETLALLASSLGLEVSDDVTAEMTSAIGKGLGDAVSIYWNTGQERMTGEPGRLVVPDTSGRPGPMQPPLTHGEKYKREIREVGTERFRVRY